MSIDPRSVYALILGGGAGTRLFPLTKDRAKPAVPFAGKYRLIDVPLSNCLNSGIAHISVLTQFNSHSLHRHIQQAYRLDHFSHGFIDIMAAEQNPYNTTWYQGTADAVRRNLWHLNDPSYSHVLILSGDQVYRMDYQDILAAHAHLDAQVTLAVTPKRPEEAGGFGLMKIDANFRVIDFVEKPTPQQLDDLIIPGEDLAPFGIHINGPVVLASMGIYVFNDDQLRLALDNEMDDFGKHVIPWCVQHLSVYVHPFVGYWVDVGTIRSYFQANLDITSWEPLFDFYDEGEPVFTQPHFIPNTKLDDVDIARSTISEGCFIRQSRINRSVIGMRSVIRRDSVLDQVVMLGQDNYGPAHRIRSLLSSLTAGQDDITDILPRGVGRNCHLTRAIIDKNACIGHNVIITDHTGQPDEDGTDYYVRDGIVIIPNNAVIPSGTRI